MYDYSGQMVAKYELTQNGLHSYKLTINLSSSANGMYDYKVVLCKEQYMIKFVITR